MEKQYNTGPTLEDVVVAVVGGSGGDDGNDDDGSVTMVLAIAVVSSIVTGVSWLDGSLSVWCYRCCCYCCRRIYL